MGENLALFEPVADIPKLPLPWSEEDFESGVSRGPSVCLESCENSGGIYAELVKALTLWYGFTALNTSLSTVQTNFPGFPSSRSSNLLNPISAKG